jgi:DNA-binding IclR family transcriptional regulator
MMDVEFVGVLVLFVVVLYGQDILNLVALAIESRRERLALAAASGPALKASDQERQRLADELLEAHDELERELEERR